MKNVCHMGPVALAFFVQDFNGSTFFTASVPWRPPESPNRTHTVLWNVTLHTPRAPLIAMMRHNFHERCDTKIKVYGLKLFTFLWFYGKYVIVIKYLLISVYLTKAFFFLKLWKYVMVRKHLHDKSWFLYWYFVNILGKKC